MANAPSLAKAPLEVFTDFLRSKDLRMTPQRRLILEVFLDSAEDGRHLASEELFAKVRQQDASVGQATVYRTLKLLAESGLAKSQQFGDGRARYEPQYGVSHHDHLICQVCRRTVEILDPRIESLQEELARKHGFVLTGHQMDLYGVCPECRKETG